MARRWFGYRSVFAVLAVVSALAYVGNRFEASLDHGSTFRLGVTRTQDGSLEAVIDECLGQGISSAEVLTSFGAEQPTVDVELSTVPSGGTTRGAQRAVVFDRSHEGPYAKTVHVVDPSRRYVLFVRDTSGIWEESMHFLPAAVHIGVVQRSDGRLMSLTAFTRQRVDCDAHVVGG